MYYRSSVTGRIITDTSLKVIEDIYGKNGLNNAIKYDVVCKIDPDPSVIDCIEYGTTVAAIMRYREIHKCSRKEARKGVARIKRDMARFAKKGDKKR